MEKHQCTINFIGRIEKLEERILKQIRRIQELSPKNPKFTLNICVCYTSHDEIENAREQCFQQNITPNLENIIEKLEIPQKVDLLIRTSGVLRISNFLLLQSKDSSFVVVDALWPELSLLDIVQIFIKYQLRNYLP